MRFKADIWVVCTHLNIFFAFNNNIMCTESILLLKCLSFCIPVKHNWLEKSTIHSLTKVVSSIWKLFKNFPLPEVTTHPQSAIKCGWKENCFPHENLLFPPH